MLKRFWVDHNIATHGLCKGIRTQPCKSRRTQNFQSKHLCNRSHAPSIILICIVPLTKVDKIWGIRKSCYGSEEFHIRRTWGGGGGGGRGVSPGPPPKQPFRLVARAPSPGGPAPSPLETWPTGSWGLDPATFTG